MGTFDDFIRYGLPGYLYIVSILISILISKYIIIDLDFIKDSAEIIGATLIIIGPLIGFLIHQIYFLYFDWRESYTKISRGCIRIIYKTFTDSKYYNEKYDDHHIRKNCFIAWKFLSTNFESDFKIEPLFLSRLRNTRNFSHAFGAIVTSIILSIFTILMFACLSCTWHKTFTIIIVIYFLLGVMFIYKRKELLERIDEMEIGIVSLNVNAFAIYVDKLMNLEALNSILIKKYYKVKKKRYGRK